QKGTMTPEAYGNLRLGIENRIAAVEGKLSLEQKLIQEKRVADELEGADAVSRINELNVTNVRLPRVNTATKEITKSRLPDDFVNSLKAMGKTEDEILDYFTKYHNENGFRFLNEIDDLVDQYPALTRSEIFALWGYTTDNFYDVLNFSLRENVDLLQVQQIKTLINGALSKLENFKEVIIFRGIKGDVQKLLSTYIPESSHTWNAFTSCGSSNLASFANKSDVIFEIVHLDAKDISSFADGIKFRGKQPNELLIKAGSEFKVISNHKIDPLSGKPIIELIQVK
ncbi:MAG: hypothetical protein ACRCYO_17680, partial [Bacteroidia bacterium]